MTVWNLATGEEHPVVTPKRRTGTSAVASLTPQEVADRAAASGARVDFKNGRHRVYPTDTDQAPVFFPDRFGDNRTRLNTISALRRAGIDIGNDPDKETTPMTASTAPAMNGRSPAGPAKPGAGQLTKLEQQFKDLLELVTENDTDRDREMTQLRGRIAALEERLAATPGAPPAKDPDADLDEAILNFMKSAPVKLTAPAIHANLSQEIPVEKVAERLQVLARANRVIATGEPSAGTCIYHLPTSGLGSQ
jgi:hypothetical protein